MVMGLFDGQVTLLYDRCSVNAKIALYLLMPNPRCACLALHKHRHITCLIDKVDIRFESLSPLVQHGWLDSVESVPKLLEERACPIIAKD